MGYYDQRADDGEYWVIPSQVDSRHGIKCPFCSKYTRHTSDNESHESHKDSHWSCYHCDRPFQFYICSNCDEIAALPGKKGKGRRKCRVCQTRNLTSDWCFDDYSYSDDEESSDEEDYIEDYECVRTLIGHYGARCVAVLPDGCVVSGSYDKSLIVWDPTDGRRLRTLIGDMVSCVAALPDGPGRIVSGDILGQLIVWDPNDGRRLREFREHSAGVKCVAVLPDGCVVSGSWDDYGSLIVWDPDDGRCLRTLTRHSCDVACVAVLPDGRVVSGSGSDYGSLIVWNPIDGRYFSFRHSDNVNGVKCVAVLPDGRIVSGSGRGLSCALDVWQGA
jgi:WD40 repeat protein